MTTIETPQASPTTDAEKQALLSVRDLGVSFRTEGGEARAVDGVSFDLFPGEVLGIVGESGSGKSVTSLAIMRLIPDPPGKIVSGQIMYGGEDIVQKSYPDMRDVRGNKIAMIFQEPMTALNPVFTVGMQVMETILTHEKVSKSEARDRAVEMLEKVGIPEARKRLKDYPHQFSGGMRQRVMIALALVCHPNILIADEPTTALDVTTQAQILELMLDLKSQKEDSSIILITHDLAVVAETCQRVIVMYGGKIQEVGTVEQIFTDPKHPYTKGLLASLPSTSEAKQKRLYTIPGNVPALHEMPEGCKFCTRCSEVVDRCHSEEPPVHQLDSGQLVRCHLFEEEK
ncbi:MAG: peptide ABC transporter ATP-binding protein [Planctomycetaceae bacterium]|nr:peptide ABC transporter ATP-binding protein [Planctomycetaceae bacterium]